MFTDDFQDELEELVSAEDFLEYFGVPFEQSVVNVNRLHILQRFHNYLAGAKMPEDMPGQWNVYVSTLTQAYGDFVSSDARTEKVLKVYQRQDGLSFVDANQISVRGS